MNKDKIAYYNEIRKKIVDEIVWTIIPDPMESCGGQSCGTNYQTLQAYHEELDITIAVGVSNFKSKYNTKLFIINLFELAIDEILNLK